MCGIAGYVNADLARPVDRRLLERMTQTLIHRGPDEEGYYAEGPVALGIRRLRIIDLQGGKQPMCNEDRTVWVVFNGEIYNFRELRRALEPRHRFTSRSDTEVIVHLYEERGAACVEAMRGMFAFALWDSARRTLLLARDHVGEKPLYYASTRDAFWFGSEIKALLQVPELEHTIDPVALDDYLALGHVPAPKAIFSQVSKLPSGSVLRVIDGGPPTVTTYWRPNWHPRSSQTFNAATHELWERLNHTVALRSIADVPLGAFLSGGIDSTTIVLHLRHHVEKAVKTFSIGFDQPQFDELPYAREVARALGTEHYEEVVKPDALVLLPKLVEHFDEPFGDSSAIPTYLVSVMARQHVTVALSGDGGDELFAGYQRYQRDALVRRLRPLLLGAFGMAALAGVAAWFPDSRLRRRVVSMLKRAALPEMERYFGMVGLYTEELRRQLLIDRPEAGSVPSAFEAAWREFAALDGIRRLQAIDTVTYLPDDILVKIDRASMATSLETRAPLVDPDLIEYVASLPTAMKFKAGVSKLILRHALSGRVPRSVLERKKQGFAVPLCQWFRSGWLEAARPLLLDGGLDGYVRRPKVECMLNEHVKGVADHAEHLWLLLVFSAWRRRYFGAA